MFTQKRGGGKYPVPDVTTWLLWPRLYLSPSTKARDPIFTYRYGNAVPQSVLRNEMGFQFVEVYTTTKQINGKNIEDMLQVRQILLHTCSRCIVFKFIFPPPLQAHKQWLRRGETIVAIYVLLRVDCPKTIPFTRYSEHNYICNDSIDTVSMPPHYPGVRHVFSQTWRPVNCTRWWSRCSATRHPPQKLPTRMSLIGRPQEYNFYQRPRNI